MSTINDLHDALAKFNDVVNASRRAVEVAVDQQVLHDRVDRARQPWSAEAGIYVVVEGSAVRYVGRALKGQGLAERLGEHLGQRASSRVAAVLRRPDARVYVVPLADSDAWLAPSLELLAQWHLRGDGLLNKKRS